MKKDDGFANLPDDLVNSVPFEVIYHPLTDKHDKREFNTIRFQKLDQEQQSWNEFLLNHLSAFGTKAGQTATVAAQTGGNMLVKGIGGLFKYVANSIFSTKPQTNQENSNEELQKKEPLNKVEEKDEDIPIIILMPQHIIEGSLAEQQKWIEQYSDEYQVFVPKQIKPLQTLKRNSSSSDDSKPQFDYDYVNSNVRQDNWNLFDSQSKSVSVMPEEEFRYYQENILQIQQHQQEIQKLEQPANQEVQQNIPTTYPQFNYPSLVNKPIFIMRKETLEQSVSFITVPKIVQPVINPQYYQQNQQNMFPSHLQTEFVPLPEPVPQYNQEVQQVVQQVVQNQVQQEVYEEMLVE